MRKERVSYQSRALGIFGTVMEEQRMVALVSSE